MPLTEVAIRNTKIGSKTRKLSDGEGLQLWIMPTGSKLWNLAYRFGGKQKKLALGSYPILSLQDARARRVEAKKLLLNGQDPMIEKGLKKAAVSTSSANTFTAIADEFLAKRRREGLSEVTLEKKAWLLGFAKTALGNRPILSITAPQILQVLRVVETKGMHESARRLRSVIGEVFRYAIATTRAEVDPTFALRGALITPTVKPRAAITDAREFGGLLRAIDGFEGQPTTKAALKLMALLFPRPGELRLATWKEFDLENAVWNVPAGRAKMRRAHTAPLPRQAIEILRDLRRVARESEFVLPSFHAIRRPISENTLNSALRRLGYSSDDATAHGFRATASTLLNESKKWSADAIERALAHVEVNETRRAYARGKYWAERVEMAQWWADYLNELRGQIS